MFGWVKVQIRLKLGKDRSTNVCVKERCAERQVKIDEIMSQSILSCG